MLLIGAASVVAHALAKWRPLPESLLACTENLFVVYSDILR